MYPEEGAPYTKTTRLANVIFKRHSVLTLPFQTVFLRHRPPNVRDSILGNPWFTIYPYHVGKCLAIQKPNFFWGMTSRRQAEGRILRKATSYFPVEASWLMTVHSPRLVARCLRSLIVACTKPSWLVKMWSTAVRIQARFEANSGAASGWQCNLAKS